MKKNIRVGNVPLKFKAGLTILVMVLAFFVSNINIAKACVPGTPGCASSVPDYASADSSGNITNSVVVAPGMPVIDATANAQTFIGRIITNIKNKASDWYKAYGTKIYSTTLRNTLNKVALDAAKFAASSGEGQKPQYIVEDYKDYWKNLGDAAAGDFIDEVGKSWQVDLCQPPDPAVRLKIGLGLTQTQAPQAPNCTLSTLLNNYGSAYEKYHAMQSGDYLKALQVNFEPGGSELGAAFEMFGRVYSTSTKATDDAEKATAVTGGWLNTRNIAGKLLGIPNQAQRDIEIAQATKAQSLLSTTGDALLDASNIFLNQLAYEGMQRALRELSKGKSTSVNPSSAFTSLIQYGENVISEKLATIIKPRFDVRSDYSILSDLAICPNKDNPGPNNCAIDEDFSQAISEKLTVGEALAKGYLHGDWLVTTNNKSDSAYTLRSASILRKFRIVPVGWEQAISAAADKKVTFQDLVSCFDPSKPGNFSADFDQRNTNWCVGLVDPNWVLKAPLNSCVKQGSGGLIDSSIVSKDENGLSTLVISRSSDYCADEQTCVKEKTDGSCELYGYCNEEKRTWNFSSDSCEPVYNTCQTFSNTTNKQTVSYLENTLDYSTCNASNSGCKQYVYGGVYSAANGQIAWDKKYSIYLNRQATDCSATSEGCTKLLRGKPGWKDVNYIMDSSFNAESLGDTSTSTNWHLPIKVGVGTIGNPDGSGKAVYLDGPDGTALYSDNTNSMLPAGMAVIPGWAYTLSADVKLLSADKVTMMLGNNASSTELTDKSGWKTITVSASTVDQGLNNLSFSLIGSGSSASFAVRNLKLNPNIFTTKYSGYGVVPAYEKLLPAYLESACYVNVTGGTNDYRLKDNAPAACNNFARKCNREEVGCELFTAVKDNFSVPAKANPSDYCGEECVGYDTYLAKASYFYGTSADNIIPKNSKTCSAESAGCASFTNLDAVSQGGEKSEYYAQVRQCIKPDTASCGDFYSWDNSQLKVMSLKKDSAGAPYVVNAAADTLCNKDIYNLAPSDPNYNPDCREFYNKSGQITYHVYSNTVSCSDNCHTYRLNEKNLDKDLTTADSCKGTDKNWDASQGACYVCKNGGVWDAKQNACLYQAIPDEGTTCTNQDVGCREYNGNNGNNIKQVASYGFEIGLNNFIGVNGGTVNQSLESTAKNGHSLAYSGTGTSGMQVDASTFAQKSSAYVVKFMAKAGTDVLANFYFINAKGEYSAFNIDDNNTTGSLKIKGGNQWNLYEINLKGIDHDVIAEKFVIKANNSLFIDNIIINQISDRFYLIKDSSDVPDTCSYDIDHKYQGPNYNIGCSAYKDRAGTIHNLRQFGELCQDSAVGCEQMIQTNNSSDYSGYTLNLNASDRNIPCTPGTNGCLQVKGHQAIYAVYDSTKLCNTSDLGCTRFGYSQTTGGLTTWLDSYKKNLPDTYRNATGSPLCQANEVGCDTWAYGNGSNSYFKDPGLNTCVFQDGAWQKTAVKRCDTNTVGDSNGKITGSEKDGPTCLTDSDCGQSKCINDTNKYDCNGTSLKTFGFGGTAGRISSPKDGAVGLCSSDQATCSEYIDPVSKFVNNLVYNPSAEDIDGDGFADKWTDASSGYYSQRVTVKPNKLYILQITGPATPVNLDDFSTTANGTSGQVQVLSATSSNQLSGAVTSVSATSSPSLISFYTGSNTYLTVNRYGTTTSATTDKTNITIREAIINYQLSSEIDAKSCTVSNTDGGCILFNTRTQAGASGLKQLSYNAVATAEGSAPVACQGANCTANQLIKVSPDRVCSRWLSCKTYIEDPLTHEKTCYAMGECDSLNDKQECNNFLAVDNLTRNIGNSQNKNATGYSMLNNYYLGGMKEVGQNTDAHFDFENNSVNLSCRRNIDVAGSALDNPSFKGNACSFDKNVNESLVLTPNTAPTSYPAHGKGFLKVLNYYQISPMSDNSFVTIYPNQDYFINYLINTKGSGAKAKLIITGEDSTKIYARFVDQSDNGWIRVVHRFKINSSDSKKPINIKIYLTSDVNNTNSGYVYFDDINIEPVLQTGINTTTGEGNYVAKDCRLYPSDDSLSCLSTNNNVVKDGLYGYCLQYDPLNPGVCLMWYPIDQISPVTRNNQSSLGYSGKFPLYYCSEVNGDFQLVEKRVGVKLWYDDEASNSNVECVKTTQSCTNGNGYLTDSNYVLWIAYDKLNYGKKKYLCVPDEKKLLIKTKATTFGAEGGSCGNEVYYEGWGAYDGLSKFNASCQDHNCSNLDESKNYDPSVMVYNRSMATENNLKATYGVNGDNVYRVTCNRFAKLVDNDGNNMAWTGRLSRNTLFTTTTPSYFFNFNATPSYSYAPASKTATAPVSCDDSTTCPSNQVCSGYLASCDNDPSYSGQPPSCSVGTRADCDLITGCLWNVYSMGTCTETVSVNPYGIYFYGRNREDVPFGAAVIPSSYDLTNSARIPLRNQYSQINNETILAGRPYGCSTNASGNFSDGCKNIGQCSLNPNVFCFYGGANFSDFNKLSCSSGGDGECVPLWNTENIRIPKRSDNNNIFNKLFIKDYADYSYSNGYLTTGVLSDWANKGRSDITTIHCPDNVRSDDPVNSFCTVFPDLGNIQLKLDGNVIPVVNNEAVLTKGGLYELDFNSFIDPEQQPLKQIVINWGDSIQVITNVDNKPNAGAPHQFYHYFTGANKHVEIKIFDNWGAWTCVATSNGKWSVDACTKI